MLKTIATITAILISAAVIFGVYCTFFVVTPGDVTEKFFNAIDDGDINVMIACMDPQYERVYNATSSLLGGFLKFSLKDAAELLPIFLKEQSDFNPNGNSKYRVKIIDTKIWQSSLGKIEDSRLYKLSNASNLLGKSAIVTVEIDTQSGRGRVTMEIPLKKFECGWRIVDELK